MIHGFLCGGFYKNFQGNIDLDRGKNKREATPRLMAGRDKGH
jgi:hypothetical protein